MNLFKNRLAKITSVIIAMWSMIFIPAQAMAQAAQAVNQEVVVGAILTVLGLTIVVLIVTIFSLSSLKNSIKLDEAKNASGVEVEEGPSWWSRMMAKMTDAVPVEQEADVMLDHNYDGIRELDNHLPPWWKWLFYLSTVFGIVYMLIYHVFDVRPLQIEEYEISMNEAQAAKAARQAALEESGEAFIEADLQYTDDPSVIASGEVIYNRQCLACHRDDGGGGIGPNLTDQYWLHGGTIGDIFNTIKVGVPDKGMISWEAVLTPEQMRDVSVYIITLVGTNPVNPKEPQGDIFEGDAKENSNSSPDEITESSSD